MAISERIRSAIRQRANGLCEYCHADEHWQFIAFTVDHIQPVSLGGSDALDNLALACRNCNERRGNRISAKDPQTGQVVFLFHPRRDRWPDHFIWDTERTRIIALTATGRVTLSLLDLNDENHQFTRIRVRKRDIEGGFHPPDGDPVVGDA